MSQIPNFEEQVNDSAGQGWFTFWDVVAGKMKKISKTNIHNMLKNAGDFNPTISFGGASVGITYSEQNGRWNKIGDRYFFDIAITLSAKGTSTGTAKIEGFPVSNGPNVPVNVVFGRYINMGASITNIYGNIVTGSSEMTLRKPNGAGGLSTLDETDFTDTTRILCSFSFEIS